MVVITSVVGARPQFIKLAPISRAFAATQEPVTHRIVHTGQHYDHAMSDVFFEELDIPRPDVDLEIGSGSHADQTAAMMVALESEFESARPDAVIVYGDTNSTLAATLSATKMHIPVCHVEAGLRSFNRNMPEEINRLVADHCADRLYAPTPIAMAHLDREGLADRAVLCGDVMLDAVRFNSSLARKKSRILEDSGLVGCEFGVVTIHRPVNTTPDALRGLLACLQDVAGKGMPLLFPMHPRARAVLGDDIPSAETGLRIAEPFGYLDMLRLLEAARVVLTDSGGLQKEAAFLGTPCVTLREETEWTETIEMGANVLVGQSTDAIEKAVGRVLGTPTIDWSTAIEEHYGAGNAAQSIVDDLLGWRARVDSEGSKGNQNE